MFLDRCHFLIESLSLQDIKQRLCEAGLLSVRDEMSKVFNNMVCFVDADLTAPIDIPTDSEILTRPDGKGLCHIYILQDLDSRRPNAVELHIIASNESIGVELMKTCGCFADITNAERGTIREVGLVRHLSDKLADSANGKMLKDEDILAFLPILFEPQVRNSVREVSQLYGQDAVPQSAVTAIMSKKLPRKKSSAMFKKLTNELKLFDRRYVIVCDDCATPVLEFSNKEKAGQVLEATSSKKCKVCDQGKMQVVEAYALGQPVYKALQQGVWLEKLTYDSVKPFSVFAAAGQMLDTFELDVIAVGYDQIILIDCKDTSFGQNDFVNVNAKAKEIEANVIGIVTTQPINENVRRLIDRTKQQTSTTIFTVENTEDSDKISSQIQAEVGKLEKEYVRRLLGSTGFEAPWLRGRRFMTMRQNR